MEQELDEKTKKEMLGIAAKFCVEALLEKIDDMTFRGWLNHNLDSDNIGTTVAELTKLAEKVKMTNWERIQNRLKYGSINLRLISSKSGLGSFFVYDKAIRSSKLKNEAKKIQRTIEECSQSTPYRKKITKWERFYRYFC